MLEEGRFETYRCWGSSLAEEEEMKEKTREEQLYEVPSNLQARQEFMLNTTCSQRPFETFQ